jgi:hypothetical protein
MVSTSTTEIHLIQIPCRLACLCFAFAAIDGMQLVQSCLPTVVRLGKEEGVRLPPKPALGTFS